MDTIKTNQWVLQCEKLQTAKVGGKIDSSDEEYGKSRRFKDGVVGYSVKSWNREDKKYG